jgi:hypothetical protein
MSHERLKQETIERLKKAKFRFHLRSIDDVVNKALDAKEGREIRKLEHEIDTLKTAKNTLEGVNEERRKENQTIIEENTRQIDDLKEKHNIEINKKNYKIETLTKKIKDFEEKEPQENAELPAMKTSIETERTTERVIEKQKIVQEAVLPDVLEGKKILCPKTNQEVTMKEQCNMKNCKDFLECKVYIQMIKEVYSFNE